MIFSPSVSAGFQSSSLVGASSVTINLPSALVFFSLKANTQLTIANIFGANPSWADPAGSFADYISFYANNSYDSEVLNAIYVDYGAGPYWADLSDFSTNVTNTVVASNNNALLVQTYITPATIPLLNGNLAINPYFN
jgi:hypothetical protein